MTTSIFSPSLRLQQVPGTPLLQTSGSTAICSPCPNVPDIDNQIGVFRAPFERPTPSRCAPDTPGMTVPWSADGPSRKLKDTIENMKYLEKLPNTQKQEQCVPSCSPYISKNGRSDMLSLSTKQHSKQQISLFTDDDIFA